MRKLYLLCLLIVFTTVSSYSRISSGYIITKSGTRLTGFIGDLYFSDHKSEVVFINDFGTPYSFSPRLIDGFVFQNGSELVVYESKYARQNWMFLKIIAKGKGINLYQSPEEKVDMLVRGGQMVVQTRSHREFWVENRGRNPQKVKRLGFRKQMRRLLKERAPKLAKKIGSPGYKYRNLEKIIEEYNEICRETRWRL
ncbi:MAG: hypothetical protein R3350_06640 [Saprospiraceae bacterium]|nr:hypothetical protein [Saprospiraceae bacterium]